MSLLGLDLQEIPASPFKVKVDPSHDAGKVRAEGPGLNKTGEETKVATTGVTLIVPNWGHLINYSSNMLCVKLCGQHKIFGPWCYYNENN